MADGIENFSNLSIKDVFNTIDYMESNSYQLQDRVDELEAKVDELEGLMERMISILEVHCGIPHTKLLENGDE